HIAGVLRVAGAIDEHELATRRAEVPIGDVDGDPLLPLCAQAVRDERDVGVRVAALTARPLDRADLIGIDRPRIDEQTAYERALSVVDGADRREVEQIRGDAGHSEVALALAILHRRVRELVVRARCAALADLGRGDLADDILHRLRARTDRSGARHVTDRSEADVLLRARPLLVAARASKYGVELVLGDRIEQRDSLQAIARGARAGLLAHATAVDGLLHTRDDEALPQLRDTPVAERQSFGEVVPSV